MMQPVDMLRHLVELESPTGDVTRMAHIREFLGAELANGIDRTWAMINRHIEDVAAGTLQVVVDRTFPLAEAAAAHAYIESRQAVGRVVLVP